MPKRAPGPRQHNLNTEGEHSTNRRNVRLCVAFNHGECQGTVSGNRCKARPDLAHQRSCCLSPLHPAIECNSLAGPPCAAKGKGKQKV
eukprot:5994352-Amphidinium_carterae.1